MRFAHGQLSDGTPLRVRLPHSRDRDGLRALHARLGLELTELDLARVLRFDPTRESVLCAIAWIDGRETLVAYAIAARGATEAGTVLADGAVAPGARDALSTGLASLLAAA